MKELNRFRKFLTEDKKSISGGMLLSENAPGYDNRKFGNPLPTLESVQAAHEAKKDEEDEVSDGVRSAAEKLGMKPSHIKEEERAKLGPSSQFTFEPNDPKKDLMIHTIVDEYQDKIFDYLWNYELYKNEYSKDFGY